ncbi:Endo-1,4-beta-xylanase A precursor [compost metagenome]
MKTKIAEAEGVTASVYTVDSFAVLTLSLNVAKTVAAKADATEQEVKTALDGLTAAIASLRFKYDEPESSNNEPTPGIGAGTGNPTTHMVKEDGSILLGKESVIVNGDTAIVSVAPKLFEDAVKQIEDSKQTTVTIQVPESINSSQVTVQLPADAFKQMRDNKIDTIRILSSSGEISIPTVALGEQVDNRMVSISMNKVNKSDLSLQAANVVGDSPVYDFSIMADGKHITTFAGNASVSITVSYSAKLGEDPNKIVMYYLNDNGELEVMKFSTYDKTTGKLTFQTPHLSKYVVKQAEVIFKDVESNRWSKPYIDSLAARGIIAGKSDLQFEPGDSVTRAEFIKLVMEAFDLIDAKAQSSFSDVTKGEWYYQAVASAEKLGIVSGLDAHKFGTQVLITRQDMAVMMGRAAAIAKIKITKEQNPIIFKDASSIADYALESVSTMQQAGILDGLDLGIFAPNGNATREQAAKLTWLLFELR